MLTVSKALVPAVLILGLAGAASVLAAPDGNQPPVGRPGQPGRGDDKKADDRKKDDRKVDDKKKDDRRPDDRRADEKRADEKKGPAPKADAVVDAWVKTLLEKITDPHDTVRESARGAVVAVGPAAVPALQRLADGDDAAKAVAARKLIGAIQGRGPGGPPSQPGRPGFGGFPGLPGGMGPGGAGFPGGGRGERKDGGAEVAPMPRAPR